ncbi:MAG: hypothetical protein QM699_11055 [Amaricoccus sp.]|uniref:hypothetical protein n=1 Tax=Amaricoccus sp. TaxID=1872485 RepID=UPI0039E687D2
MALWIGLGAMGAVGIVIAAVLLRPGPLPEAPAAEESVATTPAPLPSQAVSGGAPDAALAGVQAVRLRIGPEVSNDRRDGLVAALKQAGVPDVVVEPLPFRIATSRIGYFRDADLPAAQALARVISPAVGEHGTIGVRDYGQLLTDPQPGRLDLWIGG